MLLFTDLPLGWADRSQYLRLHTSLWPWWNPWEPQPKNRYVTVQKPSCVAFAINMDKVSSWSLNWSLATSMSCLCSAKLLILSKATAKCIHVFLKSIFPCLLNNLSTPSVFSEKHLAHRRTEQLFESRYALTCKTWSLHDGLHTTTHRL